MNDNPLKNPARKSLLSLRTWSIPSFSASSICNSNKIFTINASHIVQIALNQIYPQKYQAGGGKTVPDDELEKIITGNLWYGVPLFSFAQLS